MKSRPDAAQIANIPSNVVGRWRQGEPGPSYETILPERLDVLLLSVGENGQVVSTFTGGAALENEGRRVLPALRPKAPHDRLTFTPKVIQNC